MPSIYLHNYFTKDLNKRLDKEKIYKINNPEYFYIFAQSFDNLFVYNFLSLKKGNKIRNLGHYAHTHKSWEYFKNMITYIKNNKLYSDDTLGYLYGSLSHYVLDSTFHPYVHYISGRFNKKDKKNTKKYMGQHAVNEIMLDAIFYNKDHNDKYYKYKLYKDIIPYNEFPDKLKKVIDYTFKNTFNFDNMGNTFNKSYNQNRNIYKLLMYDRFNVKKALYYIFDFLTPFKNFKSYSYSHHINKINYDVLNLNKDVWYHPVTNEKFNYSVDELYEIAMKKVIKLIKSCNDYFNDKITIEKLEKIIGNNSYSTGLDLDIRPIFTHFKY